MQRKSFYDLGLQILRSKNFVMSLFVFKSFLFPSPLTHTGSAWLFSISKSPCRFRWCTDHKRQDEETTIGKISCRSNYIQFGRQWFCICSACPHSHGKKSLGFTGFPSSVRHLVVPAVTKNRMGFAQVTQSSWRALKTEKVLEIDWIQWENPGTQQALQQH